ncbi:MAG: benzoyl-CoA 2,3-epoxidase subunit BoxB, partial [Stellaceae bacterium]
PLARTTRFMLTEEGHHMFVGDTGIARVLRRTVQIMREVGDDPDAVRRAGAIDLATIQRYLNFWFSSSLDLFGAESSSNAAAYFAAGIKGRPDETRFPDHLCRDGAITVERPDGAGGTATEEIPLRNAMNEVTRQAYVKECAAGVERWNRTIAAAGIDRRLTLPSPHFRRTIGAWAGQQVDPEGRLVGPDAHAENLDQWLPSREDRAFVASLMRRVAEPGQFAGWIAPPERGINDLGFDYPYVRFN